MKNYYSVTDCKSYIEIRGGEYFSPRHTFECGQCFRWRPDDRGGYSGVAGGHKARIWETDGGFAIDCTAEEFAAFWRDYLDLGRSYTDIAAAFDTDDFTRQAMEFGHGLRVLRQEPWEALCSFIISQCNNIPRIMKIVDALCTGFGEKKGSGEGAYCTFPTPERLAALTAEDLSPLRAGYRAGYIIEAAGAVAGGGLDFEALRNMSTEEARKETMKIRGIGRKVADCFLLFGMGKMDAFPVDTWMKKAAGRYQGSKDGSGFGENAGIAQQYIFYFARSTKIEKQVDIAVPQV